MTSAAPSPSPSKSPASGSSSFGWLSAVTNPMAAIQNYAQNKIKAKGNEYFEGACRDFRVWLQEDYQALESLKNALQNSKVAGQPDSRAMEILEGLSSSLSADEYGQLLFAIGKASIEGSAVGAVEVQRFIDQKKEKVGVAGLVKTAAQAFFSMVKAQGEAYFGKWKETFAAPAPEMSAIDRLIEGISKEEAKVQEKTVSEYREEIQQQTQLLVDNATKMTLANTILGYVCGLHLTPIGNSQAGSRTVELIVASGEGWGDFDNLVFQDIHNAMSCSWARKFLGKTCYVLLKPIARFFIGFMTRNFLNYTEGKTSQFYNGNFNNALNTTVGMINDHLTAVSTGYKNAAKNPTEAIPKVITKTLRDPEFNGKLEPDDLYTQVGEKAIELFAPVSDTSAQLYEFLAGLRLPQDSLFSFLNYPIAFVTFLIYGITYPFFASFEWGTNKLAKWTLKKLLKQTNLIPNSVKSTGEAIGIGKEYKHAMNVFLVQQLEKAWEKMNSKGGDSQIDIAAFERKLSKTTRRNLLTLVSTLFLDVGYYLHSSNPAELQAHIKRVSSSELPEAVQGLFQALGIPTDIKEEAKVTTVKYLAVLLHTIIDEKMMLELTLKTLATTNAGCFTVLDKMPTAEEMQATEERRNNLLSGIVTAAIRQSVNDKFYPMKRIQREADRFVLGLHTGTAEFITAMNPLQDNVDFAKLLGTYNAFKITRSTICKSGTASGDANNDALRHFNELSLKLKEKLDPMKAPLDELCALQTQLGAAKKAQVALEHLHIIFAKLDTDLSSKASRDALLAMVTTAETDDLAFLEKIEPYKDATQDIKTDFAKIKEELKKLDKNDEALRAVEALNAKVEAGAAKFELLADLKTLNLTNATINTHFTNLIQKGALLADEFGRQRELNTAPISAAVGGLKPLGLKQLAVLQPLETALAGQIKQFNTTMLEKKNALAGHVADLQTWTSTPQDLLKEHIRILFNDSTEKDTASKKKDVQDNHLGALKVWGFKEADIFKALELVAAEPQPASPKPWDTAVLKPFKCQNTFPVDLTAFADTVREFVVSQIASYTNSVPLFFEQEFNWEGLVRRTMVEFVNEK